MKKYLFICVFYIPVVLFSVSPSKEAMLQDFEIIKNTYKVGYAPGDWKKQFCDWEIERAADESILLIKNMRRPNVKVYQHIVSTFLQSMNDVHVRGHFFSTELSMLPFFLRTAENRFFIAAVHEKFAEENPGILNVGDEVLSFDGMPVSSCLNDILKWKKYDPQFPTHRSLAAFYLTLNMASQDFKVQEGVVTLTIKREETGEIEDLDFEWFYQPERITHAYSTEVKKELPHSLFRVNMSEPFFEETLQLQNQFLQKKFQCKKNSLQLLGARKSFVPKLGELLWESEEDSFFHAYLFETEEEKKVGYLRIPHFSPPSLKDDDEKIKEVEEFIKLITYFDAHSEALVIDVVDNPGGAGLFMYALASMLTDKPLHPPKFRHTITQRHIYNALDELDDLEEVTTDQEAKDILGDSLQGYPVDLKLAKNLARHCQYLIDEWNRGKKITGYDYLLGMPTIDPHPFVQYTKPLLVLTNELSVSCGDFFPAVLQDNQRATIFGAKTAGAGGGVQTFSHPNHFGIAAYSCTTSIAERVNKEPIENLGVEPDIEYEVSVKDLKEGYPEYAKAVKEALKGLLEGDVSKGEISKEESDSSELLKPLEPYEASW